MARRTSASTLQPFYEWMLLQAKNVLEIDHDNEAALKNYKNDILSAAFVEAARASFNRHGHVNSLIFAHAAEACAQTIAAEESAIKFSGQLAVDVANAYGIREDNADLMLSAVVGYSRLPADKATEPSRETILTVFEKALVQICKNGANPMDQMRECIDMKLPGDFIRRARQALADFQLKS